MLSRIPLSIIFSAEGKRHAIPHCTFRVSLTPSSDAAGLTAAQKEGFAFFHYLDSNDTRLPSHPQLSAYAQPAEEYETYVGEEVWQNAAATTSDADDVDKRPAAVPAFHSVVDWVERVFAEESWAADGAVLCGRYVVADDGAWVVPSRSPTLFTTREVFLLMRNSCKFLEDVHAQVTSSRTSDHSAAASANACFEFTLAKSLAGSGASEMRAILPYALHRCPGTQTWTAADTAASLPFAGIGQRMTDACFPSLMAWTEAEHDGNYRCMHRRIEQAALLERTCAMDPDFVSRLVARFYKRNSKQRTSQDAPLALLLTVDLLFEGPSLPLYVLSAKARVYEVAPRSDAAWSDVSSVWAASSTLWVPLLKMDAELEDAAAGERPATPTTTATAGPSPSVCAGDSAKMASVEEDEGEEEEVEDAAAALNFFRMFRDVEHWNEYVVAMARRLHEAATAADALASADSNKPSREVRHYCVIASESGDLVTCADTLTKRGLPLELMHPELLELNGDAAGFLKMLRDGLFKAPNE